MSIPYSSNNDFYGGFTSRSVKTVDQPVPKAFRNQSRRSHEPTLRSSSSMEQVLGTAAGGGGAASPTMLTDSPSPFNGISTPNSKSATRASVGTAQGLSASGRKKFECAASLVFPNGDASDAAAAPMPQQSSPLPTTRRTVTPPIRTVSPSGRRTFFALPNSPCSETAFLPISGGKGIIKDHPNQRNGQMAVVLERGKSPLSVQPTNTRRSADRRTETTLESDTKFATYTGGKRCPSPTNNSLLGILRPEVAKAAPSFKLRAPFATD